MRKMYRLLAGVCLVAAWIPSDLSGAFTPYTIRTNWSANSTLDAAFGTNGVTWIDFDTTAESGGQGVVPLNGSAKQYSGSVLNTASTMTIQGFLGVSIYALGTGGAPYWLQHINDTNAFSYNVPFVTGRPNQSGSSGVMRINVPTGTTAFAVEFATGCLATYGSGSCFGSNLNLAGTMSVNTSAGLVDGAVVTSGVAGALTFFGFTSDTPFSWIELTPSTPNTVVATRISYGALNTPGGGGEPTSLPEANTSLLVGAALITLGFLRRKV